MRPKPFVLVVLDGWGYREENKHNAIAEAKTPFFDHLWATYPHSKLDASEESVGLPEGQMGNSEIGHMTIGSGRVIDTDLVRITKDMHAGGFNNNEAFRKLFEHCKANHSTLHVMGLATPGGIHSHIEHLYGFLDAARAAKVIDVAIHAITDGRDTPPKSGAGYLAQLEAYILQKGVGRIASISGRFYTMDRDNNWDRLEKTEAALYDGVGRIAEDVRASDYLKAQYEEGEIDEHMEPTIFMREGKKDTIRKNDGVFTFNFRSDRMRMISRHLSDRSKDNNICFVTMTEYDPTIPAIVAYPSTHVETTIAAEISRAGLRQAHIAETEKYPHATYFLNGGHNEPHAGEEFILIDSRKVRTHAEAPEMRACEITDAALERIEKGVDFIFLNYANADLVGHTADKPAIITAVEVIDRQLERLVTAVQKKGGEVFITADHGNAEINVDPETGEKHTAHTTNVVPAILTTYDGTLADGTLADVGPTVLTRMGLPVPPSMTGKSLLHAR